MNRYADLNRGLWDRPDPTRDQRSRFGRRFAVEGGAILEVGCAAGDSGPFLGLGNRLVGLVAVEDYVLRLGPDYGGRVAGDAVRLPFRAGSFDSVVANEFIEHLSEPDGRLFLAEVRRVLRDGGPLVLTTPNPDYWRTRLFRIRISGGPHLRVYGPGEPERLLDGSGFRVIRRRGLGRMAFPLGQHLPLVFYGDYGLVAERA